MEKNQRPQVMVYLKRKAYTPKSKEETDQWGQVLEFQKEFPNRCVGGRTSEFLISKSSYART
jgi:hypothetical protein